MICAHTPKIGGLEPFHFFSVFKRACCVACIAKAFIVLLCCFLDTILATPPLWAGHLDFIVQIAASTSSFSKSLCGDKRLERWARHVFYERKRKIACLEGDMCVLLSKLLLYTLWERSDVWDYSEAFTKRYILFGFFVGRLLLYRCLLFCSFTEHFLFSFLFFCTRKILLRVLIYLHFFFFSLLEIHIHFFGTDISRVYDIYAYMCKPIYPLGSLRALSLGNRRSKRKQGLLVRHLTQHWDASSTD